MPHRNPLTWIPYILLIPTHSLNPNRLEDCGLYLRFPGRRSQGPQDHQVTLAMMTPILVH